MNSASVLIILRMPTLQVSIVAGVLLALALWSLLVPTQYGKRLLRALSPALLALYTAWVLASYLLTSLQGVLHIPSALHSIGLYSFQGRAAVLVLGLQLAVTAFLAGLRRSRMATRRLGRAAARHPRPGSRGRSDLTHSLNDDSVTIPLLGEPSAEAQEAITFGSESIGTAGREAAAPGSRALEGAAPTTTDAGVISLVTVAIVSVSEAVVTVLWCLGFAALPLASFVVGASKLDVLHGIYLLLLVVYLVPEISAPGCCKSRAQGGSTGSYPEHLLLRVYASLHLIAIYSALCLQLPGIDAQHWQSTQYIKVALQLVGLWDPAIVGDMLPVLGVLLATTLHAAMGKWIAVTRCRRLGMSVPSNSAGPNSRALVIEPTPPYAQWSQRLNASSMHWLGELQNLSLHLALSCGIYVVSLTAYLLVAFDTPKGLLGAVYLALAVLLFLVAVVDGRRRSNGDSNSSASSAAFSRASADTSSASNAAATLRQEPGSQAQVPSRISGLCSSAALVVLALISTCDLWTQYTVPLLHARGQDALLPNWVAGLLRDAVGIDLHASGARLTVLLLRPAALLVAVYLYR